MFCNRCGATLQPEQTTCPSCGQVSTTATPPVVAQSRLTSHVHLLAIFWFVVAVLFAIGALVLLAIGSIAGAAMRAPDIPEPARIFGPVMFWAIGVFVAALAVVSFAVGYGLLKLRPWGRVLAIILGFLSLLHPPFGTALGIYTLIILLPAEAGREYDRMAVPA